MQCFQVKHARQLLCKLYANLDFVPVDGHPLPAEAPWASIRLAAFPRLVTSPGHSGKGCVLALLQTHTPHVRRVVHILGYITITTTASANNLLPHLCLSPGHQQARPLPRPG